MVQALDSLQEMLDSLQMASDSLHLAAGLPANPSTKTLHDVPMILFRDPEIILNLILERDPSRAQ